ncbi:hypothetical protein OM310_19800 [Escherichia albertii]|nr:hypothetical protein [Escherichia albertii]
MVIPATCVAAASCCSVALSVCPGAAGVRKSSGAADGVVTGGALREAGEWPAVEATGKTIWATIHTDATARVRRDE